MRRLAPVLLGLAGAACGDNRGPAPVDADELAYCTRTRGTKLALRQIAYGCKVDGAPPHPGCMNGVVTLVTSPPGDPRLFALELNGRIRLLDEQRRILPAPVLDLSADAGGPVNGAGITELGLLGLAFHPGYATNRQLYVFYTTDNPDPLDVDHPYLDVLARYTTSRRVATVTPIPLSAPGQGRKSSGRRVGVAIAFVLLLILFTVAISIVLRPRGQGIPRELSAAPRPTTSIAS
jgi:hypothetical protein